MKLCPRCAASNQMRAKFCVKCGYTFAGAAPPLVARPVLWAAGIGAALLIVALVAGLVLSSRNATRTSGLEVTPPPGAPVGEAPSTRAADARQRALRGTVQIFVPLDGETDRASGGSGSVLTEQGHILTNFHVIGDVTTGQLLNRDGRIYVAVSPPDLKAAPQIRYVAELVDADVGHDLALIRIRALQDGSALPADLGLTTLPVGDSDTVKIGDALSIIGFPGLGGNTVTFTQGSVAGFLQAEGWIKTDAEINSGNSGGAAINSLGELIGVPSAAATAGADTAETEVPGKIGLVRPINLAARLIARARADAAR